MLCAQPVLATLLGTALIAVCWALAGAFLGETRADLVAVPSAVFLVLSITVLALVPPGHHQEFLFYSVRSLMLMALFGYIVWYARFRAKPPISARVWRARAFLLIDVLLVVLVVVLVVVENTYFLLLGGDDVQTLSWLAFFPERNFAENALALLCPSRLPAMVFALWNFVPSTRPPLE